MPIFRWCALSLCLALAAPAAAQTQPSAPDIVVTGETEKKSEWKRAETEHVIVFSKGSQGELTRVTKNLERLYHLMSRIYRHGDETDGTVKLQVTLIDSTRAMQAMGLSNLRSEEGPYIAGFTGQRYYDPREDGEVLAVARTDQVIKLNTTRALNLDCDAIIGDGGNCTAGDLPYHYPLIRSWEAVLYSAFAQHFILSHVPAALPRWYLDGIGALFSTIDVRHDGAIDYALAPLAFKDVFRAYGDPQVGDVLSGRYLDPASKAAWSPYHAWLIAHYFLFSDLKPERSRQFRDYMTAIHQGKPMAEAAQVFGDMRKLQRELMTYSGKPSWYARTDPPRTAVEDPQVTTLSVGAAALIEARIELGARLAEAEPGRRADWLARIHTGATQLPGDAETILVAAEAECRGGHPYECLAAAERVLARSPDNVRALAWKGIALTDQALAGPAIRRADTLAAARKTIERAIALDGQAPLPLIAYFQSFTKAGERVPERAMLGMAKAVQSVPAAPAPRLYLGEELVRQGQAPLARKILYPVLYGAYDSPERKAAEKLLASADGPRPANRQPH